MKKTERVGEEEKRAVLAEVLAGASVKEVCKRHKISVPTFYNWKKANKSAAPLRTPTIPTKGNQGLGLAELKEQNLRLKELVANQALEILSLRQNL